MALYLGLDSSTQSLSALVLDIDGDRRQVVFESYLSFDAALPQYGTRHGVLPQDDEAVAVSSPLLSAEALDVMMARVSRSGLELTRLAAISGSAQQHGSVYLNAHAASKWRATQGRGLGLELQFSAALADQLVDCRHCALK